jgi:hypothetical protein
MSKKRRKHFYKGDQENTQQKNPQIPFEPLKHEFAMWEGCTPATLLGPAGTGKLYQINCPCCNSLLKLQSEVINPSPEDTLALVRAINHR